MKLASLILCCAIHAGCVQRAPPAVVAGRLDPDATERPRLSRTKAVRLAEQIPFPSGFNRSAYRYSGTAMYYAPLQQWGVGYEPKKGSGIVGDHFIIWIDDATASFARYGYGR